MMLSLGFDALIAWIILILSFGLALVFTRSKDENSSANQAKSEKSLTLRISNIPKCVTKVQLKEILESWDSGTNSNTTAQANLLRWSFVPAAASSLSQRFWIATATFRIAPTPSELEAAVKRKIGFEADRVRVDADFFGLTPLTDPEHDIAAE